MSEEEWKSQMESLKQKEKQMALEDARHHQELARELKQALANNTQAQTQFDQMSYSKQKDYIDWIEGAKRQATKDKRLATAIEWISEGKGRNWKYENC